MESQSTVLLHVSIDPVSCSSCVTCILALPPLLFETNCNPTIGVSFGGSPFIYLHNQKSKCNSDFLIKDFCSGRVVRVFEPLPVPLSLSLSFFSA